MNRNLKNFVNSKSLIKALFVVVLFLFVLIFGINYKHTEDTATSSKWLMHSYSVQMHLQKIHFNINYAESNLRAFVISKDSIFLNKYKKYKSIVYKSFDDLKYSISNDSVQVSHLRKLKSDVNVRLDYFESLINDKNFENQNSSTIIYLFNSAKWNKNIDIQIYQMNLLEDKLLKTRKADFESKIVNTPLLTLLLLLFSVIILIFSYLKIKKDFNEIATINQNLVIANEFMTHSELIGEFGTWIWNLGTKEITYSKNVFNMLGVPTAFFEHNVQNFLDFVHPDDKDRITKQAAIDYEKGESTDSNFRIITKNGEVRHFNSKGKTITYADGNLIILGITSDITQQYLSSKSLAERNLELEQTNSELENFNQVASHDLQEPLRKIQTFLSRISDEDFNLLSEPSKGYLKKTNLAAGRMRKLIDDLLLFSQTNKSDKFEPTDLNVLIQNTLKELSIGIFEKKVNFDIEKLPKLNAIPFQIQQLFTNLIQNSIKYSKLDSEVNIKISCEKVDSKTIESLKSVGYSQIYYKISFSDNGIGFDNEYATSIFSMFNRLHSSDEYPGTGIGLAICKKIVENHSGMIEANGEINDGATFSIYLPV